MLNNLSYFHLSQCIQQLLVRNILYATDKEQSERLKSNVRKLDHVLEERTKIRQQKLLFNAFQRHLS